MNEAKSNLCEDGKGGTIKAEIYRDMEMYMYVPLGNSSTLGRTISFSAIRKARVSQSKIKVRQIV